MEVHQIMISTATINGRERIIFRFFYNEKVKEDIKSLGAKWEGTLKLWHLANTPKNLRVIRAYLGAKYNLVERDLKENRGNNAMNLPYIEDPEIVRRMDQFLYYMKSKRYSDNTIDNYHKGLEIFLRFFKGKKPEDITHQDLIVFNNDYLLKHGYSFSYQNTIINAIKLFFEKIQNKKLEINKIERPRRQKKLPNVLSKEEIKRILESPLNLKHRAMLMLIYACGLRRGELLNLQPRDINSERGLLMIRSGKGYKDRVVPIPEDLVKMLRQYYLEYKPQYFLFEGEKKGERYSDRSIQNVLKQAVQRAGIDKPVTLHWLRHSYATHLLENGINLRYIQELLGHSNSKTTEIYTHVSKKSLSQIKSPIESLGLLK